jgi:uncharacterized surface protein with fasciclin (FAS1) repeats
LGFRHSDFLPIFRGAAGLVSIPAQNAFPGRPHGVRLREMFSRHRFSFGCAAAIGLAVVAGCNPPPPSGNPNRNLNAGVDLVPAAVLAAQRMPPDTTQPAPDNGQPNLIQVVQQSALNHEIVLRALRMSGLVPTLQEAGPWTLLAPTDQAFSKLPPGMMARLLSPGREPELRALMQYHLLKGRITAAECLATNGLVNTLSGAPVVIRGIEGKITINDANVVTSSNDASNGSIHWIDNVLLPP